MSVDPESIDSHEAHTEVMRQHAATLGNYLDALTAAGFQRDEAMALIRQWDDHWWRGFERDL